MNVNPYQSPQSADPLSQQPLGSSNSVLQLLTEIRDGQQQLLQLQRDALLRQRGWARFMPLFMLPIVLLPFLSIYLIPRPRFTPPPAIPKVTPRVAPQPQPTSSMRQPKDAAGPADGP